MSLFACLPKRMAECVALLDGRTNYQDIPVCRTHDEHLAVLNSTHFLVFSEPPVGVAFWHDGAHVVWDHRKSITENMQSANATRGTYWD